MELCQISFLDLKISLVHGQYCYSHFVKPTQSDRVIQYNTHAPQNIKVATLKGEIRRVARNTQKQSQLADELLKIKSKYLHQGYPISELDRICTAKWVGSAVKPYCQSQYSVFLPYLGAIGDVIKNFLAAYNIQVIPTHQKSIREFIVRKSNKHIRPLDTHYV